MLAFCLGKHAVGCGGQLVVQTHFSGRIAYIDVQEGKCSLDTRLLRHLEGEKSTAFRSRRRGGESEETDTGVLL